MRQYILDESGKPIPEPDILKWGRWFEKNENRVVKQEDVGDSRVSTVFLGLDHNYAPEGPPVLWETMIFGGEHSEYQDRCSGSREQAEAMHDKAVKLVKVDS